MQQIFLVSVFKNIIVCTVDIFFCIFFYFSTIRLTHNAVQYPTRYLLYPIFCDCNKPRNTNNKVFSNSGLNIINQVFIILHEKNAFYNGSLTLFFLDFFTYNQIRQKRVQLTRFIQFLQFYTTMFATRCHTSFFLHCFIKN